MNAHSQPGKATRRLTATPPTADNERPEEELGSATRMGDLIEEICAFDYEYSTDKEQAALVRALRVVADDVVRRQKLLLEQEADLQWRLSTARIATELSGVIVTLRPVTPQEPQRGFFARLFCRH